jgi:hypothetical protein
MQEHQDCSSDKQQRASLRVVSSSFQCIVCNIEGRCSGANIRVGEDWIDVRSCEAVVLHLSPR